VFELGDEIHDQITQTMVLRSVIWLLLLLLLGRSWLQVLYAGARFASNEWENRALPVVMTAPALAETVSASENGGQAGSGMTPAVTKKRYICIIDDLLLHQNQRQKKAAIPVSVGKSRNTTASLHGHVHAFAFFIPTRVRLKVKFCG
jgi:hypothetical protein